jgi:chromosomal replication initiation ATPase DnaA
MARIVPAADWSTWIESLVLLELGDDTAVIGAPNCFARDHVSRDYAQLLANALRDELDRDMRVEVVISSPLIV